MIPQKPSFRNAFLAAIAVLGLCQAAVAQDVRQNPFLPHSTAEEERIIAERERIRQAIREMMPEIKSMLMPSFDEQKALILEEAVAQMKTNIAADPTLAASADAAPTIDPVTGLPVATPPAAETQQAGGRPADARFIGCINGKAYYRDTNNIRYFDESEEAAARCVS